MVDLKWFSNLLITPIFVQLSAASYFDEFILDSVWIREKFNKRKKEEIFKLLKLVLNQLWFGVNSSGVFAGSMRLMQPMQSIFPFWLDFSSFCSWG